MVINTAEIFIVTTNKNIIKQKICFTKKNKRLCYRCPVTFDRDEHKCDRSVNLKQRVNLNHVTLITIE